MSLNPEVASEVLFRVSKGIRLGAIGLTGNSRLTCSWHKLERLPLKTYEKIQKNYNHNMFHTLNGRVGIPDLRVSTKVF